MNTLTTNSTIIARASEQLRQERETFDQRKKHESMWFVLRLIMGYASVLLLSVILIVASYIIFHSDRFSATVITAASAALFVDALGLVVAVWKIVLNPDFYASLSPVTQASMSDSRAEVDT
jgi:hypothetical protein